MNGRLTSDEAQNLWFDYRQGDMYALAKIMQCYYSDLFHWGMRLSHEREFVKDCIQDMFINLWKIQKSASMVENVRSYLMVILKTRILKELAKKQVTHLFGLSDEYSFSVEFASDLRLIDEEREVYEIKKLENGLKNLPDRQRELIYLRFYQDLNFNEIAEVMQLNKQSVYNLLQKSLASLRKNYKSSQI